MFRLPSFFVLMHTCATACTPGEVILLFSNPSPQTNLGPDISG